MKFATTGVRAIRLSLGELISELRRRKVFRAAAWYAGVAAAATQVLDLIANRFALPPRLMQGVILLGFLALPIICLIAWTFDVSRAGIERTPEGPRVAAAPAALWALPSLWFAVAAAVLFTLGSQQAWRTFLAPVQRPGIAVLAFDVLGEAANLPLAGGLHEAVLDELAHLSGLRVIARTSVLRFAESKPDVREVGRVLDVPYVLEGSVLRDGDKLRVHAQLIDAASNEHLWSETYDRAATDLFGVQTALARDIAARLRVTLLPAEAARADSAPTGTGAAYNAYLHGVAGLKEFIAHSDVPEARATLEAAVAAFDESLRLDPAFALAHAERGHALINLWFHFQDTASVEAAREDALIAAREALRLEPDLGEAYRALGLYHYWGNFDYARADKAFTRARSLLPNDAVTRWYLALVRRRQNRFDETIELLREAVQLDPLDNTVRTSLLQGLFWGRRYRELETALAQFRTRFPTNAEVGYYSACLAFCKDGDAHAFQAFADETQSAAAHEQARWYAARLDNRLDEALGIVQESTGEDFGFRQSQLHELVLAESLFLVGDAVAAAAAVQPVLEWHEQQLSADPSRRNVRSGLAKVYLLAGRPADARRAAAENLANTPLASGAIDYWEAVKDAAEVHAALGDVDLALGYLKTFQDGPRGYCGNWLRRDPTYASLREDPRFQQLAAESDWR